MLTRTSEPDPDAPAGGKPIRDRERAHHQARREFRRRRLRRRGRRAYIRSVYFLPSLATLGNALCGFGAIYVAGLDPTELDLASDPYTRLFAAHRFYAACFLVLFAMVFDALDGRLARLTRHTTDFGGQLDSLADAISFGAAPAFIALQVFKFEGSDVPIFVGRLIWAVGALYVSCALLRLARFNVSNEHGEQAHMSFLGLPSPGAAAAVVGFVLIQQELQAWAELPFDGTVSGTLLGLATILVPPVVAATGLLMISAWRYPHLVNQYLRGRKAISKLVLSLVIVLALFLFPLYTIGIGSLAFAFSAPVLHFIATFRRRLLRG